MKNLRSIRIEEGYTQAKISEILNISQQTYSDYENNKTEPNYETLIKIAELFNVSTDYLLGRTDELGSVVMPAPTAPALADDERQLLNYYGQMSHPMKIRVIAYCEGLLSTGQSVSSKRNA